MPDETTAAPGTEPKTTEVDGLPIIKDLPPIDDPQEPGRGNRLTCVVKQASDPDPESPTSITFLATLPMIQSALRIGSDGMRFQLDVPETELPKAMRLVTMRDKVLRVTIGIEPE